MANSNSLAHINARFAHQNKRTRATHLAHTAPLKIARTWPRADGGLDVCLMDASPGLLAGDHYSLDFTLETGARVAVTTQGFTRVHPALESGCVLQTRLQVGEGAVLEWLPEPLMLYAGASLKAQTNVELAPGATLIASEIWCAGRVGRGECFDFHRFENRWNVQRNSAPIFASALDLRPSQFEPRQLGAWHSWTHGGNFWVWGEADWLEPFWQIIENQSAVYAGASPIEGGVAVSMLGHRAHDLSELTRLLRAAAVKLRAL